MSGLESAFGLVGEIVAVCLHNFVLLFTPAEPTASSNHWFDFLTGFRVQVSIRVI